MQVKNLKSEVIDKQAAIDKLEVKVKKVTLAGSGAGNMGLGLAANGVGMDEMRPASKLSTLRGKYTFH